MLVTSSNFRLYQPGTSPKPGIHVSSEEPLENPSYDARGASSEPGPLIPDPSRYPAPSQVNRPDSMQTNWGFGVRENLYNSAIAEAVEQNWKDPEFPLAPITFKALVAAESAFNPDAVSRTGAVGLVQITTGTARDYGVRTSPPPDQRRDPSIALPAGVRILLDKHALVKQPPVNRDYSKPVADFYEQVGRPTPEQMKVLALGGYNGGASTVLRAMNYALENGADPRDWENLTAEELPLKERPLYKAIVDSFGPGSAEAKYHEMGKYPGRITDFESRTFKPLEGRRIMVDPGHGGNDPGAIGATGVRESDVNLAVSLKLRDKLKDLGADVRMTRETDRSVAPPGSTRSEELQARVALANAWPAEVFVSVHANSNENRAAHGTETYHGRNASQASKNLARAVHQEMVAATGFRDRGVKEAGFHVITHTAMPAILVETGFLSNPVEEGHLAKPEMQEKIAQAITNGVSEIFSSKLKEEDYLLA